MKAPPPGGKVITQGDKTICIVDPEFRDLLQPLTPAERAQLEENLVKDARVLEPIIVWTEEMILLDGHNRIEIAIDRDLDFKLVRMNFESRQKALEWVIDHQQGRRNLSEEGKKKLTEWRRDRVAAATEGGKSNRAIAKKEKVSERTVRNDQKARGVQGSAAPIVGLDKKRYKGRAERVGQRAPTPYTPRGDRQPGDDTPTPARKRDLRTDPKTGKPMFDWQSFRKDFARIMMQVAKFSKAYKVFNTPQRKAVTSGLDNWKKEFQTWFKATTKQKAPLEPHERGKKGKK